MNARKIREDLGKARTSIQRNDYPRALYLFCASLKDLGSQAAPMDLRSDIRTTLADICAFPAYKKAYQQPISYQPGREKEILAFFNKFYQQLTGEEDEENYNETLKRKLNLDRCLNDGKVFLTQGKAAEADQCFDEAFKYYKNEFAVYAMITRAMMDSGHYVRALGYARKGLKEKPDNQDLRALAEECAKKRAGAGR